MRDYHMKPTGEQGEESSGGSIVPDTYLLPPEVTGVPSDLLRTYPHTKRVGRYLLGRALGEGSFAKVKEGLHIVTGETVAIKVVDKHRAKDDAYVRKNLKREGHLLQRLRHRHVVHLYEILETDNSYYLVTELCRGGDLIQHIYARRRLDERQTRRFVRQIISAVDYMHKAGIIHRDLKIENLLLDEKKNIKIIDFGLSNMIRVAIDSDGTVLPQEYCVTQCGSPAYAAPELIGNDKYGPLVDVWSIGINMFAMLTGTLPFTVDPFNIKVLHSKMVRGDMNPLPEHLTPECRDLLRRLLTPDPTQRIQLAEAMKHPWLMGSQGRVMVPAPFPNTLTPDQVNSDVVQYMALRLNFAATDVVKQVCSNTPSSALAIYNLFLRRLTRLQPRTSPPPSSGESALDQVDVENEVKLKSFRHTRKSRLRKRPTDSIDIADPPHPPTLQAPHHQQPVTCPPPSGSPSKDPASHQPEIEDKVINSNKNSPVTERHQCKPKSEVLTRMDNGSTNSSSNTAAEVVAAAADDSERSDEANNRHNAVIVSSNHKATDCPQQCANNVSSKAESRLPCIFNTNGDAEHTSIEAGGGGRAGKLLTRRNSSRVAQSPLRKQAPPVDQVIRRPLPAVTHNGSRMTTNIINTTAAQQRIAASRAAAAANGRNSVNHNKPPQHHRDRDCKATAAAVGDAATGGDGSGREAVEATSNSESNASRGRHPVKGTLPSPGDVRRQSMAAAPSCSMELAELPPIARVTPKIHTAAAVDYNSVVLPALGTFQ